jgi:poly [ADP-ribose] polymerase 6/8
MNAFLNKYWSPSAKLSDSIGSSLSMADEMHVNKLADMGYARGKAVRAWNASKESHPGGDLQVAVNFLLDPNFGVSKFKPTSTATGKKKRRKIKAEVDWTSGFLVAFGSYFAQRFATVNDYCVICDLPHIGVGASLLKPCVCTRDLCCWSFQQLGVGADASSEIATPVDVTDLLVSMVISAARSNRKDAILEPFPTIFDPKNPSRPALSPEHKDWELLNKIVTAICSVDSKLPGAWRHGLQKAHDLAWPLLNWITSSNRSHLVRLPPAYFINSMGTPYQYLLISAPPEKEAAFQRNKKQYGSYWAFHGSGPENWHSILRRGLINASGTSLQLNGAAYGHGIYISPAANVSFGYSRLQAHGQPHKVDNITGLPDPLRPQDTNHCIALCEVVNNTLTKNNDIWVQKDPENVVTRIFFVYPKGVAASTAINNHTSNAAFIKEIEAAAKFFVQQTGEEDDYDSDE